MVNKTIMQTNTRSDNVTTFLVHPDFLLWADDWKTINDTVDGGESAVKKATTRYLPATSGQIKAWNMPVQGSIRIDSNGMASCYNAGDTCGCGGVGQLAYYLYQFRAVYYDYPAETVRTMVGRLTSEPAMIELPPKLKPMIVSATADGSSAETLIKSIFTEQSKYSRLGILADFPEEETTGTPYICVYGALRVINWEEDKDGKLLWVLLDESKYEQNNFTVEYKTIYRICALDKEGVYFTDSYEFAEDMTDTDRADQSNRMLTPREESIYPTFTGNKSTTIPFVFINATNIDASPELPVLNSVVSMALAIYRGEADYRQGLFMQSQATPTFTGVSMEEASHFMLGAGGLAASDDENFKAAFLEVSGAGAEEARTSQENLHNLAKAEGMKLIEAGAGESGEALAERTNTETISLKTLADTAEMGLRRMFEILAEWGNVSGEIEVNFNKDFDRASVTPKDLLDMVSAYNANAPILREDIHKYAKKGGLLESEWKEVEDELDMTGRNDARGGVGGKV